MFARWRSRVAGDHASARLLDAPAITSLAALCLCLAAGLLLCAVAAPAAHAASTGDITGTVTNTAGTGLAGIDVIALDSSGNFVKGSLTGSDGSYDLSGLAPGTYRIFFYDYPGTYLNQYYDKGKARHGRQRHGRRRGRRPHRRRPWRRTAASMARSPTPILTASPTSGSPPGAPTAPAAGPPSPRRYTEWDGSYDLGVLAAGTYRVGYAEWGRRPFRLPAAVLRRRHQSRRGRRHRAHSRFVAPGDRHHDGCGRPHRRHGHRHRQHRLANIYVSAWRPDGRGGWNCVGGVYTAGNGSYDIGGLTTGDYRIEFDGRLRRRLRTYLTQYYDNEPSSRRRPTTSPSPPARRRPTSTPRWWRTRPRRRPWPAARCPLAQERRHRDPGGERQRRRLRSVA